ncbi:hypothetical protein Enr8_02130 [Blastopirellula retiformator]|uniref:Uncharacterized protein n=2 Tax=Blastopirellula retiformator TaxID=2527970 RepID=A0A5C5VKS0_9BACT|nr:hypothetical protein Enr8_02130 [Blastopirellula retiformator]
MPRILPTAFLLVALLIAVTLIAFCFPSQTLNHGLGSVWVVMMLAAGCAAIGGVGPGRQKYVGFLIASGFMGYWELGGASPKSYTAPILAAAEQIIPPNELYKHQNAANEPSRFYPDGFSGASYTAGCIAGGSIYTTGLVYSRRRAELTPLAKSIRLLSLFWFGLLAALLCHYIASRTTPENEAGVG